MPKPWGISRLGSCWPTYVAERPPNLTPEEWAVAQSLEAENSALRERQERAERKRRIRQTAHSSWFADIHFATEVARRTVAQDEARQRQQEESRLAAHQAHRAQLYAAGEERRRAAALLPRVAAVRNRVEQGRLEEFVYEGKHRAVLLSAGDLAAKVLALFERNEAPITWRQASAALQADLGSVKEGAVRRAVTEARQRWREANGVVQQPAAANVLSAARELQEERGEMLGVAETLSELEHRGLAGVTRKQVRGAAKRLRDESLGVVALRADRAGAAQRGHEKRARKDEALRIVEAQAAEEQQRQAEEEERRTSEEKRLREYRDVSLRMLALRCVKEQHAWPPNPITLPAHECFGFGCQGAPSEHHTDRALASIARGARLHATRHAPRLLWPTMTYEANKWHTGLFTGLGLLPQAERACSAALATREEHGRYITIRQGPADREISVEELRSALKVLRKSMYRSHVSE